MIRQFAKSLYSPASIAEWRHQGIGRTVVFIFLLTILSIIPSVYYYSTAMMNGLSEAKDGFVDRFPDFTIKDGQLSADIDEPITISNSDLTIIFDPEEKLSDRDRARFQNYLAFQKNNIFIKTGPTTDSFNYELFGDIELTKDSMKEFLDILQSLLTFIIPIFIIIIFLFRSALSFIQVTILAWIGMLFKKEKTKLTYKNLWVMSAYSIVIPTVFFTIMDTLKTAVPFGILINWFAAIVVLYLAIKEVPKDVLES